MVERTRRRGSVCAVKAACCRFRCAVSAMGTGPGEHIEIRTHLPACQPANSQRCDENTINCKVSALRTLPHALNHCHCLILPVPAAATRCTSTRGTSTIVEQCLEASSLLRANLLPRVLEAT